MRNQIMFYARLLALCALVLIVAGCSGCGGGSGSGTPGVSVVGNTNGGTTSTGGSGSVVPPSTPSDTQIKPGGNGVDVSSSLSPDVVPNFDITQLQDKHTIQGAASLDNTHFYEWTDPITGGAFGRTNTFVFESDGRFLFENATFILDPNAPHRTLLNWYGSYRIASNNVIELVWQSGDHETLTLANTGNALVIGAKTFKTFVNK